MDGLPTFLVPPAGSLTFKGATSNMMHSACDVRSTPGGGDFIAFTCAYHAVNWWGAMFTQASSQVKHWYSRPSFMKSEDANWKNTPTSTISPLLKLFNALTAASKAGRASSKSFWQSICIAVASSFIILADFSSSCTSAFVTPASFDDCSMMTWEGSVILLQAFTCELTPSRNRNCACLQRVRSNHHP